MKERKSRVFDKEFKLNAIRFFLASGQSYKKISSELGIPSATWVESHKKEGEEAFPGIKAADVELAALRKELAIAREERDILKKALGIFSSPRK